MPCTDNGDILLLPLTDAMHLIGVGVGGGGGEIFYYYLFSVVFPPPFFFCFLQNLQKSTLPSQTDLSFLHIVNA